MRIFERLVRLRFVRFAGRLIRRMLICNLVLATVIASVGLATHIWAASSPERQELLIVAAERYVSTPARMIEVYGVAPQALDGLVRVIEALIVGGVDSAPDREAHRYFQGRILMVLPAVYRRLGREADALERGQRAITTFQTLAVHAPARIEYRRRLAVSHDFLANALARLGRHEEAIASWRGQHQAAADLLVQQPDHWRWRWYQAGAALGRGTSLQALGRDSEALAALQTAQALGRRLCEEFPGEADKCALLGRVSKRLANLPGGERPPG